MRDHIVMIVHHNAQWLPENNRGPHNNVTPTWTATNLHESGHIRQRHLAHHSGECPDFKRFQRYAHQIFMKECTDKEHNNRSGRFAVAHVHHGNVQMANAPSMHRHIPCTPKCVRIVGIPPVTVEIAIGKVQQFADQIQKRMKRQVEKA